MGATQLDTTPAMAPQGKAHAVKLEDFPVSENAHWHIVMLTELDTDEPRHGITEARPTIQGAREGLAEIYKDPPGEDDDMTPEEHKKLVAEILAGEHDLMDAPSFLTALFPCEGSNETACRREGEEFGIVFLQLKALKGATCPCPKHTAARAAATAGGPSLTGMYM